MQLDRAHFDAMTAGDAGLQREIADLFRTQVQSWDDALTPEGDWRRAAHTMKGSARGIGLWPLAQACEAAEAAPEEEVALRLQTLRATLAEALGALDALTRELKTA
ncbi:MAG: Hpt domain-containing protein [Hyphomonadaceae bacterium]|nr:Hpt domain-containing protein [Hyphomonadaceae bacterium]